MKISRYYYQLVSQLLFLYQLLSSSVMAEQTLAEKAEMFSQLGKLPLAKNPFFIKSIANSGQFDGEGTEGMAPDFTGYSCRWIGNLECSAFKFQCDGSGIVDCTGDCPGDEDAVSKMMSMMEDKQLQEEFPLLAQMKAEQGKDPEKAKAGKEKFVKILKGCGFQGLVALAGLSDGIDFGSSKDNNDSVTHVDEEALSGFAYDYDDEEDEKKVESNNKDDKEKMNETMKDKPVNSEPEPEPETEPEPVTEKKTSTTTEKEQMKKGEDSSSRSLENETQASKQADIQMDPTPEKEEESLNNTIDADTKEKDLKSMPLNKDVTKPEKSNDKKLAQLHSEVNELQQVFLGAIEEAEGEGSRRRKRSPMHTEMIMALANDFRQIAPSLRRRIRSVAENMTANATVEVEKCKVQNLSCVVFPTTAQCSGIAMGGCMSHRKLLASIFTPRVIMMVVGGLALIVLAGVGVAVYIHKRKTSQSVEPVEPEDPNAPKGATRAK